MADPVVICEHNGDTLQLDEASAEGWARLGWVDDGTDTFGAVGSVAIPREALANLALALLPHLTGDELRRVAEAMPWVAGEWTEQGGEGSRFIGDDWTVAHVCNLGSDKRPRWEAWLDPEIDEAEPSTHPTARAAQAACDARLEAAGVRLCGEVVRE